MASIVVYITKSEIKKPKQTLICYIIIYKLFPVNMIRIYITDSHGNLFYEIYQLEKGSRQAISYKRMESEFAAPLH